MPENMSKPSMLTAPNCFQYAPSFIDRLAHTNTSLFVTFSVQLIFDQSIYIFIKRYISE